MRETGRATYMTDAIGPLPFCPGCGHPILVAPLVMTGMEEGDVLFDLVAASEPPGEEGT